MKNRRFWDRNDFDGTVHLTYTDLMEGSLTVACKVMNYSDEGLGLRINHALRVFVPLHIRVGNDTYEGEVRYCRRNTTGGYDLGIKVFFDDAKK